MGLGKEKRMFTAIRSSYLYLESLKNAALDYEKEWGFSFVYSDKNKLEGNAVDRKSTRLNSSHDRQSRMPSSA